MTCFECEKCSATTEDFEQKKAYYDKNHVLTQVFRCRKCGTEKHIPALASGVLIPPECMPTIKYPCLFGLKETCEVRKYVEENLEAIQVASATKEAKVVEKTLKDTKALQFDDKETAKEMGKAVGEGVASLLSSPQMLASMKPQLMMNYCSMCPTRNKEFQTAFKTAGSSSG